MEFYGAVTAEVRQWCDHVDRSVLRLGEQCDGLEQHVASVTWVGGDAEAFRREWQAFRTQFDALMDRLRAEADHAEAHAEEQDAASSPDGAGSGGPGGGGGDRSPQDLPGEPATGDTGKYEEFDGEIDLSDEALDSDQIDQGTLGDCWFLAGAGAVANHDPDFIREHMQQNEDGTWTVTLYDDGEPVEITVEPTFPQGGAGGPDGVNWISIYEKAAAEYYGGEYDALDGGFSSDALEMVTGREAERAGEGDFESLEERLSEGPVAVGTQNNDVGEREWYTPWESEIDDDSIVPNHAYVVEEILPTDHPDNDAGEPVVLLTNPWGPDGGRLNGIDRDGTLTLTEQEYKDNFDSTYSVNMED